MDKEKREPERFDINAAVVFRLGEELITDVVQALVELVKNSYDADATWVRVNIDTRAKNTIGRHYPDAEGTIVVDDDGHGMDETTIRRGWLTIANSPKREAKAKGRTTDRGRTPIGDKGLGRLGSQRLAQNVEITTRARAEPATEHYVAFSWADFRDTTGLGEVPVRYESETDGGERHGTQLILSGLLERERWQDQEYLSDMQRKLSGMIFPFEEAKDFRVYLEVDGNNLELAAIAKKVRETAIVKYEFQFDGNVLQVSGRAKLPNLQPRGPEYEARFKMHCTNDEGRALYEFLSDRKGGPECLSLSRKKGWFVEFGTRRRLDDVDRVKRAEKVAVNPGPFRGEVDSVSREGSSYQDSALGSRSEYRNLIRDLAGIRVYRDGFGIRVGEDWLRLGKQQTEAPSYYGLRPGNVLGFVAISARDNPNLVETTSREGFQVTPHYENFFALMTEFVKFAGNTQGFLRRNVINFLNEQEERKEGVEPDESHGAVTRRMGDITRNMSSKQRRLRKHASSLTKVVEGAAEKLSAVRKELQSKLKKGDQSAGVLEGLEQEIAAVSNEVAKEQKLLREISDTLGQANELRSMTEVLDRRWEKANEQASSFYESISLGLTAEALSHEIHHIANRLARRSSDLLRQIRAGRQRRADLIAFIEEVRSSIAAMRKQLAHLTPSLRYLREQREQINVAAFIGELTDFYEARLEGNGIKMIVRVQPKEFFVHMNRGKLTQVFDNLVLNAEYWLKEAIRAEHVSGGKITVEVDAPFVRVSDNGRGVDETVEKSLFEPFVTMKRSAEGRGLGLFVCRQLLDSESCDLVLLPDRNERGSLYAFELNLSGAVGE